MVRILFLREEASVACHVGWLADFCLARRTLVIQDERQGVVNWGVCLVDWPGLVLGCLLFIGPEAGPIQFLFSIFHALGIGWNNYLNTYILSCQFLDWIWQYLPFWMFRALAKIVVRSFEMQEWELDLLNPSLWNTNKSPCSVFCFNKFITGSLLRPFWLSCVWTKKYANSFFFFL